MATTPDTPDIAERAGAGEARDRLLLLHQLGATEEAALTVVRGERDAARAERDSRPTVAEFEAVRAERDALQEQLDALLTPPTPFSVPIVAFRAGLIPMRLRLLDPSADGVREKWRVVLQELMYLTAVYPREQPVASLLDEAVADGVMTSAERAALRGE